ncbi:MAG: bifunctional 2-C-methyl-D-erythritol 4-phosphate cytidylyltransferase/2-C-methyl-D-erythritol 2,4-cyclodiphosphate synthase [Hyphomicrobiaceae bacterium]
MSSAALIVAAGRGTRATRADGRPKQYVSIGGAPVLARTIAAFAGCDTIQVVIHPGDAESYRAAAVAAERLAPGVRARLREPVPGGATRQASVRAGLEALVERSPDLVLIHDAARPFVTAAEIDAVLTALATQTAAILALPLSDTLKRADADGRITGTISRDGLWRAMTPQGFHFAPILAAHRAAAAAGRDDLTDDAAVAELADLPVALVPGLAGNVKLTTAEDLDLAERAFCSPAVAYVRTGTGFDVHRFCGGDHVWLCGVRIAHTHGVEAHSDGDVGLHALTDALLGAIGDGDIGQHFPPSDPEWKGAASHLFLADAARRVRERGGRVSNVDVTILCEAPRIGPHREAMRARIAEVLGIEVERVGLKATTTERMGFTGRGEGLAAMAVATVVMG